MITFYLAADDLSVVSPQMAMEWWLKGGLN